MGMDPYGALLVANNFGAAMGARDPRSFGATLGQSGNEMIKGVMIQQEIEKQRKAKEEAEKGSIFGKIGAAIGTAVGSAIPGVGPVIGPAIGSALGGAAGSAIGGGEIDPQSMLLNAAGGAMKGLGAPAAPSGPAPSGLPGAVELPGLFTQPTTGIDLSSATAFGKAAPVTQQPAIGTATPIAAPPEPPPMLAAPQPQQPGFDLNSFGAGALGSLVAPVAVNLGSDLLGFGAAAPQAPQGPHAAIAQQNAIGQGAMPAQPNAFPALSQSHPALGQFANNLRNQFIGPASFAEQATGRVGAANPMSAPNGLGALLAEAQQVLFNDASTPAMKPRFGLGPQDIALINDTLRQDDQARFARQGQQTQEQLAREQLGISRMGAEADLLRASRPEDQYTMSGGYRLNRATGETTPVGPPTIQGVHKIPVEGGLENTIIEWSDGRVQEVTPDFMEHLRRLQQEAIVNPSSPYNTATISSDTQLATNANSQRGAMDRAQLGASVTQSEGAANRAAQNARTVYQGGIQLEAQRLRQEAAGLAQQGKVSQNTLQAVRTSQQLAMQKILPEYPEGMYEDAEGNVKFSPGAGPQVAAAFAVEHAKQLLPHVFYSDVPAELTSGVVLDAAKALTGSDLGPRPDPATQPDEAAVWDQSMSQRLFKLGAVIDPDTGQPKISMGGSLELMIVQKKTTSGQIVPAIILRDAISGETIDYSE